MNVGQRLIPSWCVGVSVVFGLLPGGDCAGWLGGANCPSIGVPSNDDRIPAEAFAAWRFEADRAARQNSTFRVEELRPDGRGPGSATFEICQNGDKRMVRRKADTTDGSQLSVDVYTPEGAFSLGQTSEGRWILLGTLDAEVRDVCAYSDSGILAIQYEGRRSRNT